MFVAEIGDITLFGKPEQLASWTDPTTPRPAAVPGNGSVPNPVQAWGTLAEIIFAHQRRTGRT